jgi:putative selenate reductase
VKLAAADGAQDAFIEAITAPPLLTDAKVAIIGAGPAGIAAAMFLRRNGVDVEVFEKLEGPYGIVRYIIPGFRITREQIERDYQLAVHLGVRFHFSCDPDYSVEELKKTFAHVIIATGSWGRCPSPVRETNGNTDKADNLGNIVDALDFLWQANNGGIEDTATVGRRVAVIGAGDVAMDCVRTAKRTEGVQEAVLVYRRTEPYMPATQHEVNLVRSEGLTIEELLAPISYDGTTLRCEEMELSDEDAGGRRSVVGLGTFVDLPFDTVIGATGASVETGPTTCNGLAHNAWGLAEVDASFQSSIDHVYVIGDGRLGPSTIVRAVADAKTAVRAILYEEHLPVDYDCRPAKVERDAREVHARRGLQIAAINGKAEGDRCLTCDVICEVCTEVCPNRANLAITVPGFADPRQIVHLDGLCNECGNCGTFCPHAGLPYKDKITIFWSRADFDDSTNVGFHPLADGAYLTRMPDRSVLAHRAGQQDLPAEMARVLAALETAYPFMLAAPLGATS